MSRTTKMINDAEINFVKSGAITEIEKLRSAWFEMSDDWKAFIGGWCLAYSLKLDKVLARHGVKLEEDPVIEKYLSGRYG